MTEGAGLTEGVEMHYIGADLIQHLSESLDGIGSGGCLRREGTADAVEALKQQSHHDLETSVGPDASPRESSGGGKETAAPRSTGIQKFLSHL